MPIMNDQELNAIVLNDLNDIVDEIIRRIYDRDNQTTSNISLLDEMQDEVYNAGTPSFYQRQPFAESLMGSFDKEKTATIGQEIIGEIFQDYSRMSNKPDEYVHGSHTKKFPPDVREFIAQMVIEGSSGPLFGTSGFWLDKRDFWSPIDNLVNNGGLDKFIEEAFNKRGIIWKKF
jgi:hypothetical protein